MQTKVQILGKGCPRCKELEENTKEAVDNLDRDIRIEKIYDIEEASKMGMMSAPGLAVDGELKNQGSVPKPGEIQDIIEDEL